MPGCDAGEFGLRGIRANASEELLHLPPPLLEVGAQDRRCNPPCQQPARARARDALRAPSLRSLALRLAHAFPPRASSAGARADRSCALRGSDVSAVCATS